MPEDNPIEELREVWKEIREGVSKVGAVFRGTSDMAERQNTKRSEFWQSPLTWGAIGMLAGATVQVMPLWVWFAIVGLIISVQILRSRVPTAQSVIYILLLVVGLFYGFRLVPKPKPQHFPTAQEIAAAQRFPTAEEIAKAVGNMYQFTAPARTTLSSTPDIKLIFKNSSLFTPARKKIITETIDQTYRYLVTLGFPVDKEVPPLGVSPYDYQTMSGTFPGPIIDRSIYLPHNSLDDSNVTRRVYLSYVFGLLFGSLGGGVLPDYATRITMANLFTMYYASSIAGKNLDNGKWKGSKWMQALWEVRQVQGKDVVDQYMYYTYETWGNSTLPNGDFDNIFLTRFMAGVWVKDNFGTSVSVVGQMLEKYNFTQPKTQ